MTCKDCTGDCVQGRLCPHRRTWDNYYHARYYNLLQDIKKWISKITKKNQ